MQHQNLNTLEDWLAHAERLHPVTIDLGLDRVRTVADRMVLGFACPVITVAGTNSALLPGMRMTQSGRLRFERVNW